MTLPDTRPSLALRATGLLAQFNEAGILSAADVHVASTLGRLGGETDERVLLAAALTVRGTRAGSVVLDLAGAAEVIVPEAIEASGYLSDDPDVARIDPASLPWPAPAEWVAACAASPLTTGADGAGCPLRVVDSSIWLDRYYVQESAVADALLARATDDPPAVDPVRLTAALHRLFPAAEDEDQRRAAEVGATTRLAVIAGGPGTGKTTTVARLLAVLADQGGAPPRVALAAPTGKAAARLTEAVRKAAAELDPLDRARIGTPEATTIHRLLVSRPGIKSRFRHDRTNRLPHDVVVIDETSMVPLTLMARLLEALRPATRLVLVGDPDQLASVEAGAVLGDIVGSGTGTSRLRTSVVTLERNRRYDEAGAIAELATAVRVGDPSEVLRLLRAGTRGIEFVEIGDDGLVPESALTALRADVVAAGSAMAAAAATGDAIAALDAMEQHRLLCAHRVGPRGVRHWTDRVHGWLGAQAPNRADGRYVGEPILISTNDPQIGLFNGDTGVVVAIGDGEPVAAFRRGREARLVALGRLPEARTVHTMTVHKSQGSEFVQVSLVMPPAASPLATRQTLYTAITRATGGVRVIGSAAAVERAVTRPAARASGLGARLRAD
ncbi:MAG TPA: exodeoxyribonuclease V subunit alpha [Sporichthya sp.]|nr:exodeoxyribonuclease V subunit alpha [Sporichthya sp.]